MPAKKDEPLPEGQSAPKRTMRRYHLERRGLRKIWVRTTTYWTARILDDGTVSENDLEARMALEGLRNAQETEPDLEWRLVVQDTFSYTHEWPITGEQEDA